MKTKKYRLQTVLEIRNRAKDEAARLVAFRLQQLEQTKIELNRCQSELQDCFEKQNQANSLMNEELNRGLPTHNILQHRNYLDDLRKLEIDLQAEIEKQLQVVAKTEKELETAREKLLESACQLQAIETHKSNWQTVEQSEKIAASKRSATKSEQFFTDEENLPDKSFLRIQQISCSVIPEKTIISL